MGTIAEYSLATKHWSHSEINVVSPHCTVSFFLSQLHKMLASLQPVQPTQGLSGGDISVLWIHWKGLTLTQHLPSLRAYLTLPTLTASLHCHGLPSVPTLPFALPLLLLNSPSCFLNSTLQVSTQSILLKAVFPDLWCSSVIVPLANPQRTHDFSLLYLTKWTFFMYSYVHRINACLSH